MVNMLEMLAIPRPSSEMSWAWQPSRSSSAVGSWRVPSLFFIFITSMPFRACVLGSLVRMKNILTPGVPSAEKETIKFYDMIVAVYKLLKFYWEDSRLHNFILLVKNSINYDLVYNDSCQLLLSPKRQSSFTCNWSHRLFGPVCAGNYLDINFALSSFNFS